MQLADNATATRCGKCPARHDTDGQMWRPYCGAFRADLRTLVVWQETARLEECVVNERRTRLWRRDE